MTSRPLNHRGVQSGIRAGPCICNGKCEPLIATRPCSTRKLLPGSKLIRGFGPDLPLQISEASAVAETNAKHHSAKPDCQLGNIWLQLSSSLPSDNVVVVIVKRASVNSAYEHEFVSQRSFTSCHGPYFCSCASYGSPTIGVPCPSVVSRLLSWRIYRLLSSGEHADGLIRLPGDSTYAGEISSSH